MIFGIYYKLSKNPRIFSAYRHYGTFVDNRRHITLRIIILIKRKYIQ